MRPAVGPESRDPERPGLVYVTARVVCGAAAAAAFRLRVRGADHLPARGGCVLAANHSSFLDPVLLGVAVRRPIAFLARRGLYRNPLFARLLFALNAAPVSRDQLSPEVLRRAVGMLKAGWPLTVFPEGTRSADGRLGPLRRGVALLAARAEVPIVPVRIEGAFHAWPRHRLFPRTGRIAIAFGRLVVYDRRTDTYDTFMERLALRLSRLERE